MITKYEKPLHTRYQITNNYYTAAVRFLQSYTHIHTLSHTHRGGGREGGGKGSSGNNRVFLKIVLRELLVPKQAYDE